MGSIVRRMAGNDNSNGSYSLRAYSIWFSLSSPNMSICYCILQVRKQRVNSILKVPRYSDPGLGSEPGSSMLFLLF